MQNMMLWDADEPAPPDVTVAPTAPATNTPSSAAPTDATPIGSMPIVWLKGRMRVDDTPENRARARVRAILEAGHPLVLAYSSGKDSGSLASIVLDMAREMRLQDIELPPLVLVHSNTGVEQPEITMLALSEIEKMKAYALKHRIDFRARIGEPRLNDSFPVRVIGGRAMPSFPDTRSDCTHDWKISVNERLQKQVFDELAANRAKAARTWGEPVVLTGVRRSESIARDQRISARGETADGIWTNELGRLRASPILDWSADDVWEYLGYCAAGVVNSYSDFSETMRIYRDAGGSSCVVVADMRAAQNSKPCGVRTGCWACQKVRKDHSMAQMIESDPDRYSYLKPLARLRDFISNTQYDWSRRQFIGRTIDEDGFIEIAADGYAPSMLRELLIYSLSAQLLSGVQIISPQQLIAIDARWSLYALWPPFTALKLAMQVERGDIELAPIVESFPKTQVPRLGRIHVGTSWSTANGGPGATGGIRDVAAEFSAADCGMNFKRVSNGYLVIDYESDDAMEVDEEGADLFLQFEAERMIEEYCHEDCTDWTYGYRTYLRYGTLRIGKGRSGSIDDTLRRSQWRQNQGLHGQLDLQALRDKLTVRYAQQADMFA